MLFFLPFLLLSCLFFLPLARLTRREKRCCAYAEGVVCAVHTQKSRFPGKPRYVPEISFSHKESLYTVHLPATRNGDEYYPCDKVYFMYDPQQPQFIYVDDDFERLKVKLTASVGVWILICSMLVFFL